MSLSRSKSFLLIKQFLVLALCLVCKYEESSSPGHQKFLPNDPLDRRALSQIGSSSASEVCVARELNTLH